MLNVLDDRVQVLAVSVDEGGLSNDGGMLTLSVCDEDGRNLCCAPIKSRQPVLQLHARPASRLAAVPDMDDALDMVTDCIERHTDVIIVTVYDIDRDLRLLRQITGRLDATYQVYPSESFECSSEHCSVKLPESVKQIFAIGDSVRFYRTALFGKALVATYGTKLPISSMLGDWDKGHFHRHELDLADAAYRIGYKPSDRTAPAVLAEAEAAAAILRYLKSEEIGRFKARR